MVAVILYGIVPCAKGVHCAQGWPFALPPPPGGLILATGEKIDPHRHHFFPERLRGTLAPDMLRDGRKPIPLRASSGAARDAGRCPRSTARGSTLGARTRAREDRLSRSRGGRPRGQGEASSDGYYRRSSPLSEGLT